MVAVVSKVSSELDACRPTTVEKGDIFTKVCRKGACITEFLLRILCSEKTSLSMVLMHIFNFKLTEKDPSRRHGTCCNMHT